MSDAIPENLVVLGLVQMKMTSSREHNLAHAVELIREATRKGAEIVCLPELFRTPYFANSPRCETEWDELLPGDVVSTLSALARELNVVIVGGSVYERSAEGRRFNTTVVIDADGKVLGSYRKTHIPHDPGFYEQDYFESGDLGFKTFETSKAKIAVLICYDQWYPEAARAVSLKGAEIIFYPTAIGTVEGIEQIEGPWQAAWENVQRGHAIANSVIVAAVNRVGKEGESTFWGGSFVCDAFGTTLARGGSEEEVVVATVNLEHSKYVRESWRFFYNRRPEAYGQLTRSE